MAINKTIAAILVILVIAAVLMFIYKADILSYIKNLPGFDEAGDDELDLTSLSPDELADLGFTCTADDDVRVIFLRDKPSGNAISQLIAGDYRNVYFFSDDGKKLLKTDFLMNVEDPEEYKLVTSKWIGKEIAKMEMTASLVRSIERAGGASELIIERIVEGMTVLEMIDHLATNRVRFTTIRKKEDGKEIQD